MKNRIRLFTSVGAFAVVFIILLVSFAPGSVSVGGDIAVMRVCESANDDASRIIISYDNFKHKEIDLWGYRQSYTDEWLDNADSIAATLNRFKSNGYEIISTSASGKISSYNDLQLTTFILEKK